MLYPLTFAPIFKERIWGGRSLERLYGKELPPHLSFGESWEITDRPEGVGVVADGPLAGRDLRWIMQNHAGDLLGSARTECGRFPLLVKILDAQEKLSLQVHPPAHVAPKLRGEPKTEMWYIADAAPGAELFVGLKKGVTRAEFERRVHDGSVETCFHRIPVRAGDAMFLPSGRVHAIGAGLVIFEIQQNSDTTYRVFDWNRKDAEGKSRQLHIAEAMESIDFSDFEPSLIRSEFVGAEIKKRQLVSDRLFSVDEYRLSAGARLEFSIEKPVVVAVLSGRITIESGAHVRELRAGHFSLVPASLHTIKIVADEPANFLCSEPGANPG